jgi:hypothetical protein
MEYKCVEHSKQESISFELISNPKSRKCGHNSSREVSC